MIKNSLNLGGGSDNEYTFFYFFTFINKKNQLKKYYD